MSVYTPAGRSSFLISGAVAFAAVLVSAVTFSVVATVVEFSLAIVDVAVDVAACVAIRVLFWL